MPVSRTVNSKSYRDAMRTVPGAVAIVTATAYGERHGMAATAICSLSAEPPKLIACIGRNSRLAAALTRTIRVGINFLREDQARIAAIFGKPGVPSEERFAQGRWRPSEHGEPFLEGACARLGCVVESAQPNASHLILVLQVELLEYEQNLPLVYWSGRYAMLDARPGAGG